MGNKTKYSKTYCEKNLLCAALIKPCGLIQLQLKKINLLLQSNGKPAWTKIFL